VKVALVIERMDPSRGGRETSTAQIAVEIARRGHEVTVLCRKGSWTTEGVQVRALGARGLGKARRAGNFVSDVRRVAETEPFDIIHATLPVPGANVYQPRGGTVPAQSEASLRRRGAAGRFVSTAVGPFRRLRARMGELERQVVSDPRTLCLAVSQMVADELDRHYRRRDGVRVIYNAVDVPDVDGETRAHWRQELRYRLGVGSADPVFITVARSNFALKGVTETIVAFAEWVHSARSGREARLVIVGGDWTESYQRFAGLRQVGGQVAFIPWTDEVFRWYSAADACVLLSWYDPCSRVVLEAVRWGVPAVTTRYNGASEVLRDGAGVVVDSPKDREGVVAAMNLFADPDRRLRASEACRAVADNLSIERHVDELLEAYGEATRRK